MHFTAKTKTSSMLAIWGLGFFFSLLKDKFAQKWNLSHYFITRMPIKSFVVHWTFLELHSKRALQLHVTDGDLFYNLIKQLK